MRSWSCYPGSYCDMLNGEELNNFVLVSVLPPLMRCQMILSSCWALAITALGVVTVDAAAKTVYVGAVVGPSLGFGSYDDAGVFVDSTFKPKSRLGGAVGGMARLNLNYSVFLDTGLVYGTRGGLIQESIRGREAVYDIRWELDYVTIPWMLGTYLSSQASTRVYGKAGIELDLAASSTIQQESTRFDAGTAGQDVGAAIALGVIRNLGRVSALGEIVGTLGLTDLSDSEGAVADVKFRNRTVRVFLGILM